MQQQKKRLSLPETTVNNIASSLEVTGKGITGPLTIHKSPQSSQPHSPSQNSPRLSSSPISITASSSQSPLHFNNAQQLSTAITANDIHQCFKANPLFQNRVSDEFLVDLTSQMHMRHYQPGDVVVNEGETSRAMFFIIRGNVRVGSADNDSVYAELGPGSFFGEIGLLFDIPRTATVFSKSRCILAVLTKTDFARISESYPNIAAEIRAEANDRYALLLKRGKFRQTLEERRRSSNASSMMNSAGQTSENAAVRYYSKVSAYQSCPAEIMQHLASAASVVTVRKPKGQTIFNDDEADDKSLVIVKQGKVDLIGKGTTESSSSKQPLITVGPGTFIGASVFMYGSSRKEQLLSGSDDCEVYVLNKDDYARLIGGSFPLFVDNIRRAADRKQNYFTPSVEEMPPLETQKVEQPNNNEDSTGHQFLTDRQDLPQLYRQLSRSTMQLNRQETDSNSENDLSASNTNEMTVPPIDPITLNEQATIRRRQSLNVSVGDLTAKEGQEDAVGDLKRTSTSGSRLKLSSLSMEDIQAESGQDEEDDILPDDQVAKMLKPHAALHNAHLALADPKRRRASIAVWADSNLSAIAQQKTAELLQKNEPQSNNLGKSRFNAVQTAEQIIKTSYPSLSSLNYYRSEELLPTIVLHPLKEPKLIQAIVKYLPFKDQWLLRGVNSDFMRALRCSDLMAELDFSPYNKVIDDNAIGFISKYAGDLLEVAVLKNCWRCTNTSLKHLATHARNVEVLDLCGAWDITDEGLLSLAHGCRRLKAIDLSNCRKVSDVGLSSLLANCPALSDMFLSYCKSLTDSTLQAIVGSSPKIRRLNFQRCVGITDAGFSMLSSVTLLKMQELTLSDCSFLTDQAIKALSESCPNLRYLNLSFCCALTEQALAYLGNSCARLQTLDVSFCGSAVTNQSLELLAINLIHLERLSVRGCVQVTAAGIEALVQHAQSLHTLNISGCKNASTDECSIPPKWKLLSAQQPLMDMVGVSGSRQIGSGHVRRFTSP